MRFLEVLFELSFSGKGAFAFAAAENYGVLAEICLLVNAPGLKAYAQYLFKGCPKEVVHTYLVAVASRDLVRQSVLVRQSIFVVAVLQQDSHEFFL